MNRFLTFIGRTAQLLVFGGAALVLCTALLYTQDFQTHVENDLPYWVRQNLPALAAGILLYAAACFLLIRCRRISGNGVMLRAVLVFALVFSLALIFTIRGRATNDALMLDEAVNEFMQGDYSAFGGYLATYPFQIGYVAVAQILYLIFGPSNYIAYMLLNTAAILWMICVLDRIADLLFENSRVRDFQALLMFGALFLYVYSTFVYSDVWSIALQTAALESILRFMKKEQVKDAAAAALFIAFSCLLKSNSYIALIAMLFGLSLHLFHGRPTKERIVKTLAAAVMCALFSVALSAGIKAYYIHAAGLERLPEGVSTLSYLAMGMQEAEGKCGWYNGFNAHTLAGEGGTPKEQSLAAIRESLQRFSDSKRYFVKFYLSKFLTQWNDPTFISMRELELTARHVDNQPAVVESILFGQIGCAMKYVMRLFHFLVYSGFAVYSILLVLRKKKTLFLEGELMLIVFVFGGMVFHELWEASSRYVIRYFLVMIPFAASAFETLFSAAECRFNARKERQRQNCQNG